MGLFQKTVKSNSDKSRVGFFWELQTCSNLSSGYEATGFNSYHGCESSDFQANHGAGETV